MPKRTTHRSTAGKKLYAVRDKEGKFEDIQTYKRAHSQDVKRKAKAETLGPTYGLPLLTKRDLKQIAQLASAGNNSERHRNHAASRLIGDGLVLRLLDQLEYELRHHQAKEAA